MERNALPLKLPGLAALTEGCVVLPAGQPDLGTGVVVRAGAHDVLVYWRGSGIAYACPTDRLYLSLRTTPGRVAAWRWAVLQGASDLALPSLEVLTRDPETTREEPKEAVSATATLASFCHGLSR